MTDILNLKVIFLVVLLADMVIAMPNPRKGRKARRHHRHRVSNARAPLLKVNNFSRSSLQLNTPTNFRTVILNQNYGFHLVVNKNYTPGTSSAANPSKNKRAKFELQSVGTSIIRIKHIETKRFLAICERGDLYLQKRPDDDCLFYQKLEEDHFHSFASLKYYTTVAKDVFLAVKTNGQIKPPRTTSTGQTSNKWLTDDVF